MILLAGTLFLTEYSLYKVLGDEGKADEYNKTATTSEDRYLAAFVNNPT
jgi:hypothetical protein